MQNNYIMHSIIMSTKIPSASYSKKQVVHIIQKLCSKSDILVPFPDEDIQTLAWDIAISYQRMNAPSLNHKKNKTLFLKNARLFLRNYDALYKSIHNIAQMCLGIPILHMDGYGFALLHILQLLLRHDLKSPQDHDDDDDNNYITLLKTQLAAMLI